MQTSDKPRLLLDSLVLGIIGGLLSGALVYGLAPEAEGHGTDTVVKALHRTGGIIRARVAPIKMLASAITIGSKIVAILRDQSVVPARPDTILQPGDRLLLVIQPERVQHLSQHLSPTGIDPLPV